MSHRNEFKPSPILCYVTASQSLAGADPGQVRQALLLKIAAAAAANVDWIQIREKDLSGKECAQLTRDAVQVVAQSAQGKSVRTRIIVNDRLDIAISEHAGGIHLSERGLPSQEVKPMVASAGRSVDFLIGRSCHSRESASSAEESGADYIFFGPIFPTPSKVEYGAPQGVKHLEEVCREISIPVLAIGGINLANAALCFAAGAAGIAAIRLFQDSSNLVLDVSELRRLAS